MGVIDSNLTISVTANSTSGGQGVDFSGFAGATATLVNDQASVSIQYALDGVTWVTLAAGASVSLTVVAPSLLRLRKTTADNFPVPLTVDFDFTDQVLTPAQVAAVSARSGILNSASSGADSGWLAIGPHAERLVYQLDSGTTATGFNVDVSADGVTSLGQAYTGTYNSSTVAEYSPPLYFSNPLARYFRVTITSGGPISFARCA